MSPMALSRDQIRAELVRRLLGDARAVPATALGRLRKAAGAAVRAGRLAFGNGASADGDLDLDALVGLVSRLGELKGLAMKAGQILSYVDIDIPD